MKQKISKIVAIFLGGLIMMLSFLRENIFLEINAVLDGYSYNKAYFYFLSEQLAVLTSTELMMLKWTLTIIFILLISGLSFLTIKLWFKNKEYNRIVLFIYLFVFATVLLITFILWLTGGFSNYYFILRKIIGLLHSPIPVFLYFTAYIYVNKVRVDT